MVIVTDYWDVLCNQCILVLQNLCHLTGLSYGLINILFFFFLGPLSTLCFMGSTLTAVYGKSRRVKVQATVALAALGILCILAIVVPSLWALVTL